MPTLRVLARALGDDLAPASGTPLPEREVTGVHVSELTDPTPYLEGGELLLTTGMGLTGQTAQARAYAARLARIGVAGLGLGLGPVHDAVPGSLVHACEAAGVPLLVVPAPTPFLVVARTYWSLLAQAGREELSATLGAHRDLVRAAAGPNPVPAVVRTLASAVEGWAAQLSPAGEVVEVWPAGRRSTARRVAGEVARLRVAGPHASATFPVGSDDVVLQPLASRGRLSGFVATGCPGPMRAADRQLVLTACALLALHSEQQRRGTVAARAGRACVARLVLSGHVDAARSLAADLGLAPIGRRVRVLALTGQGAAGGRGATSGPPVDEVLDALEPALSRDRREVLAVAAPEAVWVALPAGDAGPVLGAVRRFVRDRADGCRGALSAELGVGEVTRQLPAVLRALARAPALAVHDMGEAGHAAEDGMPAAPLVRALAGYTRADLVGAVVAYLRHRGQWERAAADLAVHRNTLRHRIATARRVAGVDLDDPDIASRLWLALRDAGLA